jgi:O-antigen ligase
LFIVYFVITILSFWTEGQYADLNSTFVSNLSFFVFLFVTVTIIDTRRRFRLTLLVATGSMAWASLYVIREWQKYHNIYSGFRAGWVVGDANYYGVSAVLTIPITYCLMADKQSRSERLFCFASMMITLLGVTLSASRGAFLGIVAAFIYLVLRSPKRLRNLSLVTAILAPLSLLAPSSPLDRILHPGGGDIEAVAIRQAHWHAGMNMITRHPVFGVGLGNFKSKVREYFDRNEEVEPHIAHQTYIEVAAETGIPSLLIFLAIVFSAFRTLENAQTRKSSSDRYPVYRVALGMQAGLIGFLVALFFISAQYQKLFWLVIFLSMCLPYMKPNAQRRTMRKSAPGIPAPV